MIWFSDIRFTEEYIDVKYFVKYFVHLGHKNHLNIKEIFYLQSPISSSKHQVDFHMQMKNIVSDQTCSVAANSRMFSCFLLFLLVAQQGWSKVPWMLSKGTQRRSGRPTPAARLWPVHPSLSSIHNVVSLRSETKDEASDGFFSELKLDTAGLYESWADWAACLSHWCNVFD